MRRDTMTVSQSDKYTHTIKKAILRSELQTFIHSECCLHYGHYIWLLKYKRPTEASVQHTHNTAS